MRKVFKVLGYLLATLALLLLCVAAWVKFTPMPTYAPKSLPVVIPTDSAALAVGRKIVEVECTLCHLGDDGKLSGRLFSKPDDPFGVVWSRNITQHPNKGIGAYTDGELAYLLRTGVTRTGSWAPYMLLPNLSDEHLGALIAYLRSDAPLVQPSESDPPPVKYSFLAKALVKFGLFAPKFQEIKPIETPAATDKVAYGKYLATAMLSCFKCHSASFETNDDFTPENSAGFFGGGNQVDDPSFNVVLSSNLTMSKDFGLGQWTEEQFRLAVQTGQRPDGRILSPAMPRFAAFSDDDISAIWAYLQTVPVLENNVQVLQAK